jgi:hypothetical protein
VRSFLSLCFEVIPHHIEPQQKLYTFGQILQHQLCNNWVTASQLLVFGATYFQPVLWHVQRIALGVD